MQIHDIKLKDKYFYVLVTTSGVGAAVLELNTSKNTHTQREIFQVISLDTIVELNTLTPNDQHGMILTTLCKMGASK